MLQKLHIVIMLTLSAVLSYSIMCIGRLTSWLLSWLLYVDWPEPAVRHYWPLLPDWSWRDACRCQKWVVQKRCLNLVAWRFSTALFLTLASFFCVRSGIFTSDSFFVSSQTVTTQGSDSVIVSKKLYCYCITIKESRRLVHINDEVVIELVFFTEVCYKLFEWSHFLLQIGRQLLTNRRPATQTKVTTFHKKTINPAVWRFEVKRFVNKYPFGELLNCRSGNWNVELRCSSTDFSTSLSLSPMQTFRSASGSLAPLFIRLDYQQIRFHPGHQRWLRNVIHCSSCLDAVAFSLFDECALFWHASKYYFGHGIVIFYIIIF